MPALRSYPHRMQIKGRITTRILHSSPRRMQQRYPARSDQTTNIAHEAQIMRGSHTPRKVTGTSLRISIVSTSKKKSGINESRNQKLATNISSKDGLGGRGHDRFDGIGTGLGAESL